MEAGYFDLQDIMCEEQSVKVRFIQDVPWTGMLALSDDTIPTDSLISSGTVLQMPLWLASALHDAGVAVLLSIRQFGVRVRADLAAGAEAVNLRDLSPHWYRLGIKVSQILPAENIARTLKGALSGRLGFIGRGIFSVPSECNSDPHKTVFGAQGFTAIMDQTEFAIYTSAISARKDVDGWINRTNDALKPLELYN